MQNSHVLVVGAAGLDTKGRADGPLQPDTSNPGRIRIGVGGVARNVAENLARLGEHAILLSAVGDDRSGLRIREQALDAGQDRVGPLGEIVLQRHLGAPDAPRREPRGSGVRGPA